MSNDLQVKQDVLAELTKAMAEAGAISILLENKGDVTNGQRFWKKKKRLKNEIDELVEELFDDWATDIEAVSSELKTANVELGKEIENIKRDYKNFEAIAKGLKVLDKVLGFAAKFA